MIDVHIVTDEAELERIYIAITSGFMAQFKCSGAAAPWPPWAWLKRHLNDPCWLFVLGSDPDPHVLVIVERASGRVVWLCFAQMKRHQTAKVTAATGPVVLAECGDAWGDVENDAIRHMLTSEVGAYEVDGIRVRWRAP